MSFSWKTLLGAASSNSNSTTTTHNSPSTSAPANGHVRYPLIDDPAIGAEHEEYQPLWGLENFGNTCYANSILQALYFCHPFRDVILNLADLPEEAAAGLSSTPVKLIDPEASSSNSNPGHDIATSVSSLPASPQQPPQPHKVPSTQPDTLFINLHRLFKSISAASADYTANEATAASALIAGGAKSLSNGLMSKGSRGGKAKAGIVSRQGTITSKTGGSSSAVHAGSAVLVPGGVKKRDLGVSAGMVDESAVKAFLASLRRENVLFDSTAHQDAHEFLNFMLNQIGEHLTKIDEKRRQAKARQEGSAEEGLIALPQWYPGEPQDTHVHRIFEGTLTNETRCLTCEAITSRDECFLDLSIDIEQNTSVTACLRQFSASETLRSLNKFFCDTCSGLQEAEKRMKIRKLPGVLALHLKRFKYEESTQRYIKLAYRVVFPLQLRLFNTADDAEDPDRLYELFAIVVHIGVGPHHGHYVSVVKVGSKWAIFDDDAVHYIDQLDISKYFGDAPGTGSAYVLFYQAVDLDRESLGLPPQPAEEVKAKLDPWLAAHPPPVVEAANPGHNHRRNHLGASVPATSQSAVTALPASNAPPSNHDSVALEGQGPVPSAQMSGGGLFSRRRERTSSNSQALAGEDGEQRGKDQGNSNTSNTPSGWRAFGRKGKTRSISMSDSQSSQSKSSTGTAQSQAQLQASLQGVTVNRGGDLSSTVSPEKFSKGPCIEESDAESESTHASSSMGSRSGYSSRSSRLGGVGSSKLGNGQEIPPLPSSSSTFKANPFEHRPAAAGNSAMTPQTIPSPIAESPVGAVPTLNTSETSPTSPNGLLARNFLTYPPPSEEANVSPTISRPSQSSSGEDRRASIASSLLPTQGATFAPVDHILSKKDQSNIAKEARRRSSTSAAAVAAITSSQRQSGEGGGTSSGARALVKQPQQGKEMASRQQASQQYHHHSSIQNGESKDPPSNPTGAHHGGRGEAGGALAPSHSAPQPSLAMGVVPGALSKHTFAGIGKGLPSSLSSTAAVPLPTTTTTPSGSTMPAVATAAHPPFAVAPKRRSTLSRFGFGLGKDKDRDKK